MFSYGTASAYGGLGNKWFDVMVDSYIMDYWHWRTHWTSNHWRSMAITTAGNTKIVFQSKIILQIIYAALVSTTTGNNYVISSTKFINFLFIILNRTYIVSSESLSTILTILTVDTE